MNTSSKKFVVLLVIVVLAFAITACGSHSDVTSVGEANTTGDLIAGADVVTTAADTAENVGNFLCTLPGTDPNSEACK